MRDLVTPPVQRQAGPHGLLRVATIVDDPAAHWRQGVEWQSLCPGAATTYEPCFTESPAASGAPPAKSGTASWRTFGATPFTVYGRVDCSAPGFWDDAPALAADALAGSEQYEVERAFWTGAAAGVADVAYPHLAASAQVADGLATLQLAATVAPTGSGVAASFGQFEQALAQCLDGAQGTVHVPMALVPVLADADAIHLANGSLRTLNGNLVVAGAGYPGTGPDGTGSGWVYGTGPVWGRRSPVRVMEPSSTLNRSTNSVEALTERTYVIAYDCCLVAAKIT